MEPGHRVRPGLALSVLSLLSRELKLFPAGGGSGMAYPFSALSVEP